MNGKSYFDRLADSNVRVSNITIAARWDSFEDALKQMFHHYNMFQMQERAVLIRTVEDIERAHANKQVGFIFGFQSPTPIDIEFYRWTIFYQLGLRICQLAYMEGNLMADGCFEPGNKGLTLYGLQAVQEMNRLGIVVDLSHVGERSSLEAMEHSKKPCIFSHSNAKSLTPAARNITDEQMKLCASRGGVVGISPLSTMTYKELGVQPTMSDYLDHIEYAVKLIGIDHVGFGSDVWENSSKFAWESSTKLFYDMPWVYETVVNRDYHKVGDVKNLIEGLVSRGFSEDDIKKILGANFLRVFREVWRTEPGLA